MVWLSRKHITTTHPSAKLDVKRLGPFKILEAVEKQQAGLLAEATDGDVHSFDVPHISAEAPWEEHYSWLCTTTAALGGD